MDLWNIASLFTEYRTAFIITLIGALFYCGFVMWYGKVSIRQGITLFLTGIIVITCIFLPFNWSLQHVWTEKEVSLFFFNLNIGGNNFIGDINGLSSSLWVSESTAQAIITMFLAFLEELAKLTLLILCIRKSLRWVVLWVYSILMLSILGGTGGNTFLVWTIGLIGFIVLFFLLWTPIKTDSVANYIYAIALVALWFAFAENIKYIIDLSNSGADTTSITNNAFLRSIFGYLSHTFFSMICVALYARGRFAFLRALDNAGKVTLTQKALGWKGYTKLKSIQGFWLWVIIATIVHGIYNIFIGSNILIPSFMLIVGFFFLELFVLHDLRNNKRYGNIENYLK